MTDAVKKIQNTYCSQAMSAAIVLSLIFILFGVKPVGKGFLLGALFSVINFILMAQMLPSRLQKSRRKSILSSLGGIWIRLALLALPLIIAMQSETFNFFAAAAGLFMVQIIIFFHHLPVAVRTLRSRRRPAV
jgi:hypothetical protein